MTFSGTLDWNPNTGEIKLLNATFTYEGEACGSGSYTYEAQGRADESGNVTIEIIRADDPSKQDFVSSPDFISELEDGLSDAMQSIQ